LARVWHSESIMDCFKHFHSTVVENSLDGMPLF
jgi:hypothetical protein